MMLSAPLRPATESGAERFTLLRETLDPGLREELILEHRWIAERCAARFAGRGEPYDDLLQAAQLALVRAVDLFDPAHGTTFPRYAMPSVVGALRRHFRDHTWRVSVSRRSKDLGPNLNAALNTLQQQLGRSPTPQELAEYLGRPLDHVIEALEAKAVYRPRSLNTPTGADDRQTIEGACGADDSTLDATAERLAVRRAARSLDERRRRIVMWRFYDGCTQSEIGARLGIGQVQVSRLLRSALADLHKELCA